MTGDPQATFVVEYPCDRFCRIEVDVSRERGQLTLQQLREKAEKLHQQEHAPEQSEGDEPVVEKDVTGRPAPTVFLAAPGGSASSAPGGGGSTHGRGTSSHGRGSSSHGRGAERRR